MSTNNDQQDGRQPPSQNQASSSDFDQEERQYCRKYIWGTCTKGSRCRFRHELNIEEMKKHLKFCHDYQNKKGCSRVECTFIHTSREEETLFLTEGQIPLVLAERYAALAAGMNHFDHPMMFVTGPPPPPPPPPPPAPASTMPSVAALPPPPPPHQPLPVSFAIQQPAPPPPPPTLPSSSSTQSSIFNGGPPSYPMMNQPPPPIIPLFDASRPPPSIPAQANINKNGTPKRPQESEAGPSKIRRIEPSNAAEGPCENCIENELRGVVFKNKLDNLVNDIKCKSLVFNKMLKEFETGKNLLRALISAGLFSILEVYIEDGVPNDLQSNQNPTSFLDILGAPRSTSNNILDISSLHTLLEVLFSSERRTTESPNLGNRHLNGQNMATFNATTITTSAASRTYDMAVPGPSDINSRGSQAPASAAPIYPVFQPAVPPPVNHLPQQYNRTAPPTESLKSHSPNSGNSYTNGLNSSAFNPTTITTSASRTYDMAVPGPSGINSHGSQAPGPRCAYLPGVTASRASSC